MTPRIVSSNVYTRCFHYKIFSNALFLNKRLLLFEKSNSQLCSFCKKEDKIVFHLYFYFSNVRNLWNLLKFCPAEDLTLPPQRLQAVVFGFYEKDNMENVILYNQLFLFSNFTFFFLEKNDF